MGDVIQIGRRCHICGEGGGDLLEGTDHVLKRQVLVHELCLLRKQVPEALALAARNKEQLDQCHMTLCAVVARLGGMARVHKADFDKAAQVGFELSVKEAPGGFIDLDLKRLAIVTPGATPFRPPEG